MYWELFNPHTEDAYGVQSLEQFPDGLLYGYSVYTTLKMPLSEQGIDLHLQRLKKDCKAMRLQWRFTDHAILTRLKKLFNPSLPIIRLTVSADTQGYGSFSSTEGPLPTRLYVSARADAGKPKQGLKLKTVQHQRPMPLTKHGDMAETILLKREAKEAGFDDILLVNPQGHLCEASTSNLFLIQGETVCTSDPVRDGCLPGITRQLLLDNAKIQRISLSTEPLTTATLQKADGLFLTNATQGVRQVESVDGHHLPWPNGAKRLAESLTHMIST